MQKKTKKIWIWLGISTVVLTATVLLLTRKKKQQKTAEAPLPEVTKKYTTSTFPLKVGSKNDAVKELQVIIGADPDGIFGPKTEAALKAYAGVTQVASQADLDALANKKATAQNQVAAQQRAMELVKAAGADGKILMVSDGYFYQYNEGTYGELVYTGKVFLVKKGDVAPYSIIGYTKAGNIQVKDKSGARYVVNPVVITIQK